MTAQKGKFLTTCAATVLLAVALSACGGNSSDPVMSELDMDDDGMDDDGMDDDGMDDDGMDDDGMDDDGMDDDGMDDDGMDDDDMDDDDMDDDDMDDDDMSQTPIQRIVYNANTQLMAQSGTKEDATFPDITCDAPQSGPEIAPGLSCTIHLSEDVSIAYISPELAFLGIANSNQHIQDLTPPASIDTNGVELLVLDFAESGEIPELGGGSFQGSGRYVFGILDHSAFYASAGSFGGELVEDGIFAPTTFTAGVIGYAPNSSPDANAHWQGAFAGFWTGEGAYLGNTILGESGVQISGFGGISPTVELTLDALVDIVNTSHSVSSVEATGMRLINGAFEDQEGLIKGNFYGPEHEEVAGTFIRDNLTGAFGASR